MDFPEVKIKLTAEDAASPVLREATAHIKEYGEQIKEVAIAAAGLGAAFVVALRSSEEYAGVLANTANAAGMNVEAFQALGFAAKQYNISQEEFNNGMMRFNTTLGAALNGNKAQMDLFARLGVAIRDVHGAGREATDVFMDFADGLRNVDTKAQAGRDGLEAFGRGIGPKLAAMAEQGSAGLRQMMEQAERMGAVLTKEQVEKLEEANRQWERMTQIVKTQLASAFLDALPAVNTITEKIGKLAVTTVEWLAHLTDYNTKGSWSNQMLKVQELVKEGDVLNEQLKKFTDGSAAAMQHGSNYEKALNKTRDDIKLNAELLVAARKTLADMDAQLLKDATAKPKDETPPVAAGAVSHWTGKPVVLDALTKEDQARFDRWADALGQHTASYWRLHPDAVIPQSLDFMGDNKWIADSEKKAVELGDKTEKVLESQFEHTNTKMKEGLGQTLTKSEALWEEYQRAVDKVSEQMAQTVTDGLQQTIQGGIEGGLKGARKALTKWLIQVSQDILWSGIKASLQDQFAGALIGFQTESGQSKGGLWGAIGQSIFGSLITGGSSLGGGSTGYLENPSLSQTPVFATQHFAEGGSFTVPGSSSGDNVVPIFHATPGEQVTIGPKGGGQQVVHMNITIDARGAGQDIDQKLQAAMKTAVSAAVATVGQKLRKSQI